MAPEGLHTPRGEPALQMRSRLAPDLIVTRLCETLAASGLEYEIDDAEDEVSVGGVFQGASVSCVVRVSPAVDDATGRDDAQVEMWRLSGDPRAFHALFICLSRSIDLLC